MIDPRRTAVQMLGAVDWQSEVTGYCRCPGRALHTGPDGKKDCRVHLDGAPSIHCFHVSCGDVVARANKELRRALGAFHWQLRLSSGQILHSGDSLQADGTILPRALVQSRAREHRRDYPTQLLLESLRTAAERFREDLFERFYWPREQMKLDSPLQAHQQDPHNQFLLWLRLWPVRSILWNGHLQSSGTPEHAKHFRPVSEWWQIGPAFGEFTCGSAFKPGSYQRTAANIQGHRFLVVDSDTLGYEQVGAVFAYLNHRLHLSLHAVVDTAGKSLQGWFDVPKNTAMETQLKAILPVFGCNPRVFTYSQPVRVPGAFRDGRLQELVWTRNSEHAN